MKFPDAVIEGDAIRGLDLEDGANGDVMYRGCRYKVFEDERCWILWMVPGERLPIDAPVEPLTFPEDFDEETKRLLEGYGSFQGLPYHRDSSTEEWLAKRAPDTLPHAAVELMKPGLGGWMSLLDSQFLDRDGTWMKVPCLWKDSSADAMAKHYHIREKEHQRSRLWNWLLN